MLKCGEVNKLLHDYCEGLLEPDTHKALDGHLADCPGCLAFIKTYKETILISKDLREGDLPPELKSKLITFIRSGGKPKSFWARIKDIFH